MWLDISIAISCAVAGLAGGWVMRSVGCFDDVDPNMLVTLNDSNNLITERLEEAAQGRISEVAGRLQDYATTMAKDVDAHQTCVQAVNNTLQEQEQDGTNEAVYRAVDELIAANDTMQEKLRIAQERLQEQSAQLESAEKKAHTDGLTRIANRRAFDDHLDQRFDMGHEEAGTLAILDVDHFKQFNDTYGHRAGDEVLRVVASILNARLNPYGIAARFGGEEFAVVMDGVPVQTAAEIINHARDAIGQRDIHFSDKRLRVTLSAGIAELLPAESKEDWLQRADDALYHSKDAGRDCSHWMNQSTPVLVGQVAPDEAAEKETHAVIGANDTSSSRDQNSSGNEVESSTDAINQPMSVSSEGPADAEGPADKTQTSAHTGEASDSERPAEADAVADKPTVNVNQEPTASPIDDQNAKSKSNESQHNESLGNRKLAGDASAAPAANTDPSNTVADLGNDSLESEPSAAGSTDTGRENIDRENVGLQNRLLQKATKTAAAGGESSKASSGSENGRPQAFKYLPDAEALAKDMTDLHQRSQTANIPLHVMAIRFEEGAGPSTTDALLQIVRSTLRSVDRIGCYDACTLLVCMPNLDADLALERGQQICHSAEALATEGFDDEKPCHVSVGLADAAHDTDFFHVISRVTEMADEAKTDGTNVRFAEKVASA